MNLNCPQFVSESDPDEFSASMLNRPNPRLNSESAKHFELVKKPRIASSAINLFFRKNFSTLCSHLPMKLIRVNYAALPCESDD